MSIIFRRDGENILAQRFDDPSGPLISNVVLKPNADYSAGVQVLLNLLRERDLFNIHFNKKAYLAILHEVETRVQKKLDWKTR